MTITMSIEEQFSGALHAVGLTPKVIVADGKLHRFDTNKPGRKSGWYVLHDDGLAAGAYGDWATDLQETWCAKAERQLSEHERQAHRERIKAARMAAAKEQAREHQTAAEACAAIWDKARDALADNPYCTAKEIKPIGLREFHDKRTLLVPLRDAAGKLWNLQFIDAHGHKRFKTHGKVRGCYYAFGGKPVDVLLLVEGYATGATLYEATGYPVAVAFNAGNLSTVATALRAKLPHVRIVVCGDVDNSGTGQKAAIAAAGAVNGLVALPTFVTGSEIDGKLPSDFNDMGRLCGLAAVRQRVQEATATSPATERPKETTPGSVSLMCAADVEEKPIHWLWDGWVARGKLSLLAGAAGTGKTTLALGLTATITTGGTWPDGQQCVEPGNVLIWSSEDDPADTLKPRLMACGADVRRVFFVQGVTDPMTGDMLPFDPARDIPTLTAAVSAIGGASLLLVDPIVSAVAGDMHRANDVRRGLQAVVDFAAAHNCAVLGITHFSKGSAGTTPQERVIGSQAFGAFARAVLVAAKQDGHEGRVLARAKSNISVDDGGVTYFIEPASLDSGIQTTRVAWGDKIEGSARDILGAVEGPESDDDEATALKDATQFLRDILAAGPMTVKAIKAESSDAGHSWATIRRASAVLKAESYREGEKGRRGGGMWLWRIPSYLGVQGGDDHLKNPNLENLNQSQYSCGFPGDEPSGKILRCTLPGDEQLNQNNADIVTSEGTNRAVLPAPDAVAPASKEEEF
ncbi:AAA family ATPase [Bordetella genomosp. 4]|uniref:AAA family ATPase n=1 Tax=Bordetella genomosp. 4 TaxID=463044 RepID=UPI001C3CDE6B|nr:AAA family ATPase [Bordetella genomosp. 4]